MKFLCGRPGCGKESTATLQIDAPSSTVSLVDPRISRDGVPLCARHADATTPPMGWAMNDLRSRSRPLSAVPDEDAVITSTPPRVRPETEVEADAGRGEGQDADRSSGKKMSRRQSIAERARKREQAEDDEAVAVAEESADGDHRFRDSRSGVVAEADSDAAAEKSGKDDDADDGPSSRPKRRREVAAEEEPEEDRFPWHHQFDDDEPEELQASSPLLSRAFRATIG